MFWNVLKLIVSNVLKLLKLSVSNVLKLIASWNPQSVKHTAVGLFDKMIKVKSNRGERYTNLVEYKSDKS